MTDFTPEQALVLHTQCFGAYQTGLACDRRDGDNGVGHVGVSPKRRGRPAAVLGDLLAARLPLGAALELHPDPRPSHPAAIPSTAEVHKWRGRGRQLRELRLRQRVGLHHRSVRTLPVLLQGEHVASACNVQAACDNQTLRSVCFLAQLPHTSHQSFWLQLNCQATFALDQQGVAYMCYDANDPSMRCFGVDSFSDTDNGISSCTSTSICLIEGTTGHCKVCARHARAELAGYAGLQWLGYPPRYFTVQALLPPAPLHPAISGRADQMRRRHSLHRPR